MISDAIQRIRKSEKEAEELVSRARSEKAKRVAKATEEAVALVDEMRAGMREDERTLVASAQSDAESVAERMASESATGVKVTREGAESRIGEGVSKVLGSLIAD